MSDTISISTTHDVEGPSTAQLLALALMNSGLSYADAMKESGLSFDEVQQVWATYGKPVTLESSQA